MTATLNITSATERQVSFLKDLLVKRVVSPNLANEVENSILDVATASHFISILKDLPYKRNTSVAPAPVAETITFDAPVRQIPVGIYTVADGDGWVTFKVDSPAWADGKTTIAVLVGADNERSYKNFGWVTTSGIKKWASAQVSQRVIASAQFLLTGSLDEAREQFLNLAEAHAMASGKCLACHHTLTVPTSLHRGLGPTCARRLGVA